jgi:hypothetical protein
MNTEELMHWKEKCFFCQGDLSIFPKIGGVTAFFSIKNNWMEVESKFIKLSFSIKSGKTKCPSGHDATLDAFLARSHIEFRFTCLNCEGLHNNYTYYGIIRANKSFDRALLVSSLTEKVICSYKYTLIQNIFDRSTNFLNDKTSQICVDGDKFVRPSSIIQIPYIDLQTQTPESLTKKLKTYILFS